MTAEFGATSQLEKIGMLDYADFVAINKFEKLGSEDALRAVREQLRRSRQIDRSVPRDEYPVFGTIASQFNDTGVTALYHALVEEVEGDIEESNWETPGPVTEKYHTIIPGSRSRYLAEIAETCRDYRQWVEKQADIATQLYQLEGTKEIVDDPEAIESKQDELWEQLDEEPRELLEGWEQLQEEYSGDIYEVQICDRTIEVDLKDTSLAGSEIPRVALPQFRDWGDIVRWQLLENVPGRFPYTAGVFPFKRRDEEPKRMFAGEGTPKRTNERFHYLCEGEPANRLSTAFDSVTLYGEDPAERPDIYGKVGNSGVSVCTLDDMKRLYEGFDLCASNTSVSKTINGPAPIILAMFLNTAIDQQVDQFKDEHGRASDPEELDEIRDETLQVVRGTVQAVFACTSELHWGQKQAKNNLDGKCVESRKIVRAPGCEKSA